MPSITMLLYLDYDGVLHHEDVRLRRGRPAVSSGMLFEHLPLLERLLAARPHVHIVLSTSWVRVRGFHRARQCLGPLAPRVIGATWHSWMRHTAQETLPRGEQVWGDVLRRGAHPAWVAIDDDTEGWSATTAPHWVQSDPERGLGNPAVAAQLAAALDG